VRRKATGRSRGGSVSAGLNAHAPGDGNSWVHWCLWAHGGYTVDMNDKVVINSPETEKALNYAKQLYENMIPGVASWNDASNNKAFLGNEIHWASNTISIYIAGGPVRRLYGAKPDRFLRHAANIDRKVGTFNWGDEA
jgi:ABC-type glycerol-3-phosphate transport system substrate-binding protein